MVSIAQGCQKSLRVARSHQNNDLPSDDDNRTRTRGEHRRTDRFSQIPRKVITVFTWVGRPVRRGPKCTQSIVRGFPMSFLKSAASSSPTHFPPLFLLGPTLGPRSDLARCSRQSGRGSQSMDDASGVCKPLLSSLLLGLSIPLPLFGSSEL